MPTIIGSHKLIVFFENASHKFCTNAMSTSTANDLEEISTVLMRGHFILFYISNLGMVSCIFDSHKH